MPPSEMEDGLEGEDRISKLPHDILLTILFQLEMKEAAKTSILSKTWRYLWTYWTDLNFAYLKILPRCELYCNPNPVEENKYFNWVDQVVRLHSGQSITKFKLQFSFHESQVHNVDRWVSFALSKRVKNLELDLPYDFIPRLHYTLKPSLLETDVTFLACLRLSGVNVTGDLLESLLSKCHLLEHLFVEQSHTLVRLKVVSLKLKHLSIRLCQSLEQLEIDAVNLSYLDYYGDSTIIFKNLPSSLVEVTLEGQYCGATFPICQEIACFARQLSKFSLRIMLDAPSKVCWDFPKPIPKEARVFQGLEPLSLGWGECDYYLYDHNMSEDEIEYKALPYLRVFQFVGFCGGDDDVNLILIILDMATQLHTFICHPLMPSQSFRITKDMAHVCKSRATKLESFVAPRVHNYVILNDYDVMNIL